MSSFLLVLWGIFSLWIRIHSGFRIRIRIRIHSPDWIRIQSGSWSETVTLSSTKRHVLESRWVFIEPFLKFALTTSGEEQWRGDRGGEQWATKSTAGNQRVQGGQQRIRPTHAGDHTNAWAFLDPVPVCYGINCFVYVQLQLLQLSYSSWLHAYCMVKSLHNTILH